MVSRSPIKVNACPRKEPKKKITILVIIGIIFAFAIPTVLILHQVINWGIAWNLDDFLHHENFAAISIFFGIGIFLTIIVLYRRCK